MFKTVDKKCHGLGVFVDLKKAFDTVSHPILLNKLALYGVRGLSNRWFASYLTGRRQRVRIGNAMSSVSLPTAFGVPQGSVIGPLLFLVYINDLPRMYDDAKFTLFADDTTISFSDSSYSGVISEANSALFQLQQWKLNNRLSLNSEKTVALLFTNRKCDIEVPSVINILGEPVYMVGDVKFLGTQLDKNLNFSQHCIYIASKLSKVTGIFYRICCFVPENHLVNLHYSLFYPYLTYCVVVWGSACASHIDPIIKLQKRVIRLITGQNAQAHIEPLFRKTKILKFQDVYKFHVAIYMYHLNASNQNQLSYSSVQHKEQI